MARILMLTTQFSRHGEPADPVHQLADAFVAQGHTVKVVVIPWQQAEQEVSTYRENDRLSVLRVPPLEPRGLGRIGSLLVRWTFSSFVAMRHAQKFLAADDHFDLIYTSSPAVVLDFLIRWSLRRFKAKSYLYIVDFFPFHQRALGLVPGGAIFALARAEETRLIRKFDVVACMSPRNVAYLKSHYALRPEQRVEILPLSTGVVQVNKAARTAVRARHGLPEDKVLAVFGGQITEGRGIEEIVAAARQALATVPELHFVLAGKGRLTHLVEEYIRSGGTNLTLIPGLPRDAYLELAAACDIGLVVTVPIADIPTFPSKTLDYLQASLPIVAAVEDGTDYRDFVEEHGFGIVVPAGDADALLNALKILVHSDDTRARFANAGAKALLDIFDVRRAPSRIIDQV